MNELTNVPPVPMNPRYLQQRITGTGNDNAAASTGQIATTAGTSTDQLMGFIPNTLHVNFRAFPRDA